MIGAGPRPGNQKGPHLAARPPSVTIQPTMHAPLRLASLLCALGCLPAQQPRVLFFTHSAGFTHPVVKRAMRGQMAWAELNARRGLSAFFQVDCSQDPKDINAANLAKYSAVAFYTTGELPVPGKGLDELFAWIKRGGAFLGVHSATDTLYKNPTYMEMINGAFAGHPWHMKVPVLARSRTHPAVAHFPERFIWHDEIYQFRGFDPSKVEVLLQLDPAFEQIGKGRHQDPEMYPLAWGRAYGKGRVFYTALGHRRERWIDPLFLEHLHGALRWAMEPSGALRRPPADAQVLFDGTGLEAWRHAGDPDKPIGWEIEDGVLTIRPGTGSIVTRQPLGDAHLHLEFRIPEPVDGKIPQQGNSGVYLQRRYEVQILNSHGGPTRVNGCGSLYKQRQPRLNMCRAPGEWQSYDIYFRAARFDEAGKRTAKAMVTVVHNGVLVHFQQELSNKTGAGRKEGPKALPLLLQDHGAAVSFRNIWLRPLGS